MGPLGPQLDFRRPCYFARLVANGNLLSETTGTQVKQYAWDLDNRLKQVTLPSLLNTFAYDANGLRIQKLDSTGTTKYLLDGPSVLEEINAGGATVTSYQTNPQVIDEIVSFQQAGATYYPLTDALGSIYAVTNSSGSAVATYGYDVYGTRTQTSGTLALSFGYTGKRHDADTLLIDHNQRERDPSKVGWLQADRVKMAGGPNYYLYASASPTMFTDPTGKFDAPAHKYILEKAFPDLGDDQLNLLISASLQADSLLTGQFASGAAAHAMRKPGQSLPDAASGYRNYVAGRLAEAVIDDVVACRYSPSLYSLGFGIHAVADSFSPYHKNFQVWFGYGITLWGGWTYAIGVWFLDYIHYLAEKNLPLTDPSIGQAIQGVKDYYRLYKQLSQLARVMPGLSYDTIHGMALGYTAGYEGDFTLAELPQ